MSRGKNSFLTRNSCLVCSSSAHSKQKPCVLTLPARHARHTPHTPTTPHVTRAQITITGQFSWRCVQRVVRVVRVVVVQERECSLDAR